jgi:hypothetical protein
MNPVDLIEGSMIISFVFIAGILRYDSFVAVFLHSSKTDSPLLPSIQSTHASTNMFQAWGQLEYNNSLPLRTTTSATPPSSPPQKLEQELRKESP